MPSLTQSEYLSILARQGASLPSSGGQTEAELHQSIIEDCAARGWLYFRGAMNHRTRRTLGEPDFIVLRNPRRCSNCCLHPDLILVECKSAKRKQSPEQLAVSAHARKLGHTVHVVRNMKEWYEVIKRE